jgi:hypothetical protein
MRIYRGTPDSKEPWNKTVDFSDIEFPSDRISIKTLRKLHPDLFDKGFADEHNEGDQPQFFYNDHNGYQLERLAEVLFYERVIAAAAYAKAAGLELPERFETDELVPSAKEWLERYYKEYGVADGPSTTKELIRGIERQARKLAKGVQR